MVIKSTDLLQGNIHASLRKTRRFREQLSFLYFIEQGCKKDQMLNSFLSFLDYN